MSSETVKTFHYKGYDCEIRRNLYFNNLTGYVKLPEKHKYYGKPIDKIPVDCHGGLTYGQMEGNFYIIGFDCGHFTDFDSKESFDILNIKNMERAMKEYPYKPNKNEGFVIENIKNIVDQL